MSAATGSRRNEPRRYFRSRIDRHCSLVVGGVGTAVLGGSAVGTTGIALAFGLSLLAMVYVIGPISGCHINPAVTPGAVIAKRITPAVAAIYVVAQLLGAAAVFAIASGKPGYSPTSDGLGTNGYGSESTGEYSLAAVALVEVLATAILVLFVLRTTAAETGSALFAGIPIGLTLTLVHLVAIGIDSTSVNPARSIGPALIAGHTALSQVWVFIVFPLIGAVIAAGLVRVLNTTSQAPDDTAPADPAAESLQK